MQHSTFYFLWRKICRLKLMWVKTEYSSISFDNLIEQYIFFGVQANLDCVNGETTSSLKDHSKFSILGHYVAEYNSIMKKTIASESSNQKHVTDRGACLDATQTSSASVTSGSSWRCCSHIVESCLGHCLQHSVRKSCWIQIFPDNHNLSTKNIIWVPQLHHIHQNGLLLICSFHVSIASFFPLKFWLF